MNKFLALVAGTALAAATVVAGTGSAQAPGVRTLTLFENTARESSKLVDNAPKSPTKNPDSRRFRLSSGDELVARTPLYDRKGGKRAGIAYVHAVAAKGSKFQDAVFQGQVVLALHDGDLVLAGLAGAIQRPFAVLGGTGAYKGARGSATEQETDSGAELTIRLLP